MGLPMLRGCDRSAAGTRPPRRSGRGGCVARPRRAGSRRGCRTRVRVIQGGVARTRRRPSRVAVRGRSVHAPLLHVHPCCAPPSPHRRRPRGRASRLVRLPRSPEASSRSLPRRGRQPRRSPRHGASCRTSGACWTSSSRTRRGSRRASLLRDELPAVVVVFLTSSPDEYDVFSAIISGARGYVLKQSRSAELVRTLEAVGRGESMFDGFVTGMVLERIRRIASGDYPDESVLTAREREILRSSPPAYEPGDRRGGLPLGQDRQELRQLDPGEAGPGPARPGALVRRQPRPAAACPRRPTPGT